MKNSQKLKKEQRLVDKINCIYKVGDKIKVKQDDGDIAEWTVRAPASILGGHSAVVWCNEYIGCYSAGRVIF